MHRFCENCISTALRKCKKECPVCRRKIVSKRWMRPDPNFDLLISKLYPERDFNKHQMGELKQRESSNHNHSRNGVEGTKIEMIFTPHPTYQFMALKGKLVRCLEVSCNTSGESYKQKTESITTYTSKFTVKMVSRYLAARIKLENEMPDTNLLNVCIYIEQDPLQIIPLNEFQTLQQVKDSLWKVILRYYCILKIRKISSCFQATTNTPMQMFYSVHTPSTMTI